MSKLKARPPTNTLMGVPELRVSHTPCAVCHDNMIGVSVGLCGHLCHQECASGLTACPICGMLITCLLGIEQQEIGVFSTFSEYFTSKRDQIIDFYQFFANCGDVDQNFKTRVLVRAEYIMDQITLKLDQYKFFANIFMNTLTQQVQQFQTYICSACSNLTKPDLNFCLGCGSILCGSCRCQSCNRDVIWQVVNGFITTGGRQFPAPYRDQFGQVGGVQGGERRLDLEMVAALIQEMIE